ncbi:hypothetical protein CROQUDRAFT_36784 [Cronartium quercuum f. sp. fusiforme G11]|uniref:Uncharacterized protein n=1 Tax=Cronartium quercuum f. sp. fusiforme G11 TaxID=708437 RepID=A0A9P6TI60_9BASI|nr:hypothetical protein CROQUDRAFT_36784 [Cronartium quercuum f. sp. fusiforme G11]
MWYLSLWDCCTVLRADRDTPVESLHVVLLGVAKYLYQLAVHNVPTSDHNTLVGHCQSFITTGLNADCVQAVPMVKYANNLVGKEFQLALQAAAFVLYEFLNEDERYVWATLGHLASYIFQTQIFNKEKYMEDLKY